MKRSTTLVKLELHRDLAQRKFCFAGNLAAKVERQDRPTMTMQSTWSVLVFFLFLLTSVSGALGGTTRSFDSDWLFFKGDSPGAERQMFDDTQWRKLNVPHDWSIEGPFAETNPTGPGGGYLPSGVGWYRKHFRLPIADAGKRVFVDFDAVMANSDVWINGTHLGKRPNGYVSFRYELTGHLQFGNAQNVLVVRADNSGQPASRWYTGAGIYRHVRLVVTASVHLGHWSTFITTPKVSVERAVVRVESEVVNQSSTPRNVTLQMTLQRPDGSIVNTIDTGPQTVEAGKSVMFVQEIETAKPELWGLETPALYSMLVRVREGKDTLDREAFPFGIREYHFDPATGFWLNGKNLKIKGACLHHDGGAVGSAVPLGTWERRLTSLKQIGVNAIRTSHNSVSPEFLELCDRMGFLVVAEMFDVWISAKRPYDYHLYFKEWSVIDTRDSVHRDRNHPSIVVYSAGNEIRDTVNSDLAKSTLRLLLETFHQNDPTRPVTQGLFRPNVSHDYDNGLADMLDVIGQNYREKEILAAHAADPRRKILGTETTHDRNAWLAMRDSPPYAGQFLWAGVDYLGEAHHWPEIAADFGLLDRTGAFKVRGYERQSWWSDGPVVHMARRVARREASPTDPGYETVEQRQAPSLFSDWTPSDISPHKENVEVYSNCEEVELLLNHKSLGVKTPPVDASPLNWSVPFEPGMLRAECRVKKQVVAVHEMGTAGRPAKIALSADKSKLSAQWDDVSYLTATVVDEHGVPVPSADNLVSFTVAGSGEIIAVDNGDNMSTEPFQARERHAYQGRCIAILRMLKPHGRARITASSQGLAPASVSINAE